MEKGVSIDFNGLVRVVLKLSGLMLAVYGAVTLASYFPVLLSQSEPVETLAFLSGPTVFIVAGLFLWLFPAPIANTVVRSQGAVQEQQRWSAGLVEAGSVLIGLWWLIAAMSDLVYHVMIQRARESSPRYTEVYSEFGPYMTATVVELVLAIILIFGARGIVGVIQRVRRGGLALDDERR